MRRTHYLLLGIFVVLLAGATAVYGQSDQLRPLLRPIEEDDTSQVGDQGFPQVTVEVRVVNEFNVPVRGLDAADFALTEDQSPVDFTAASLNDTGQPISVLLALDISGPMQAQLAPLRQAAILLYDTLEQTDESGIIAFAATADGTAVDLNEPIQFITGREHPFTSDEGALINHINALQVEEGAGTPLFDALFKSVRLSAAQAQHDPRAVILITNGRDVSGDESGMGSRFATGDMVIEEARRARIPIYTISWNNAADNDYLQRAADFTGGMLYQVFEPSQITAVYNDIAHQLRQRYRLTYQSTLPPDGGRHLLQVSLPNSALPATAQSEFVAHPPLTPQIEAVSVQTPETETAVPLAETTLRGEATLIPQIAARNPLAIVNYYLDGAEVAVHAAGQAPWSFAWDTVDLAPGGHTLLIEAIDTADPPNVGVYETAVSIAACSLLCQGEQLLGFNPLFILGALLVVAFTLFALLWNNQTGQPERADLTPPPPQPRPVPPSAQQSPPNTVPAANAKKEPTPRPAPEAPPPTAATARKDSGDKTEVLTPNTDQLAFLLDVQNGQGHRLGTITQIGAAADNDITVDEPDLPDRYATIRLDDGQFLLQSVAGGKAQVNEAQLSQRILQEGDRIQIGSRLFVFKMIK